MATFYITVSFVLFTKANIFVFKNCEKGDQKSFKLQLEFCILVKQWIVSPPKYIFLMHRPQEWTYPHFFQIFYIHFLLFVMFVFVISKIPRDAKLKDKVFLAKDVVNDKSSFYEFFFPFAFLSYLFP